MRSPMQEASALADTLRAASMRAAVRDFLVRVELILAFASIFLAVWIATVLALPFLASACRQIRFVWLGALGAATAASAWRAAAERISERSLAAIWERAFPGFDGCLLTAVEAARGVTVPAEILAISSRNARNVMRSLPVPTPVPERRPAGRTHVFLCLTFAVHLLLVAYLQADYFRGLVICLWASPSRAAVLPAITEIRPGNVEIVEGDPIEISALVQPAGLIASASVETDSWFGGDGVSVGMRLGERAVGSGDADRWVVRFPAALNSFRYRIAAVPERPAAIWPFRPAEGALEAVISSWHEVRVETTLRVIGFRAVVSPPQYTGEAERSYESPFFEALSGSVARIEVVVSREDAEGVFVPSWGPPVPLVPLSSASGLPPPPAQPNRCAATERKAGPGGKAESLADNSSAHRAVRMSVEFHVGRGGEWEIRLSSVRAGGVEAAGGIAGSAGKAIIIRGAVTVRLDRPPTVYCRISDGAAVGECGLPVELHISDDFGIYDAALIIYKSGGGTASYVVPAIRGQRELARAMYIPGDDLVPGETIEYVLQARDNFPSAHQASRTEPKKFTVPKMESVGPMFGGRRSLTRPGKAGEGLREPGGAGESGGSAGPGKPGDGSDCGKEGGDPGMHRKAPRSGPERLEDAKEAGGGETGLGGRDRQRRPGGPPGVPESASEYEAPPSGSPQDRRRRTQSGEDGNEDRRGSGADGKCADGRRPASLGDGRTDGDSKGNGVVGDGAKGTGGDSGSASGGASTGWSGVGTDAAGESRGAGSPGGTGGSSEGAEGGSGSGSAGGRASPQPPPGGIGAAGGPGGGADENPTPGAPHKRARDAGPKTGSETGIGPPSPETVDASRIRELDDVSVGEAAKYASDRRIGNLRRDFGGEKANEDAAAGGRPSVPKGQFDPALAIPEAATKSDADRNKPGAEGKDGATEAEAARKLKTLSPEYRALAEQYLKRIRNR